MRCTSWILFCVWWAWPTYCTPTNNNEIVYKWHIQKLDNFNENDNRTWKQRYRVIDDFYIQGGPVFLFIGGEESVEETKYGAWEEAAEEFQAICFYVEHRFYGDSHCTEDSSVENLKYLTTKQALADLAKFIIRIPSEYGIPYLSKWVTIGGSYSGILSAQMRIKYPHLVHTAVSSSAALFLKMDFPGFFNGMQKQLKNYDPICESEMKKAVKELILLLKTPDGSTTISQQFSFCSTIEIVNEKEKANLLQSLAHMIAQVVQHNIPKYSKKKLCDIMIGQSSGSSAVDRFAAVFRSLIEFWNLKCLPIRTYDQTLAVYSTTSFDYRFRDQRLWMYQLCTEIGSFPTSNLDTDLFGPNFSFQYYDEQCTSLFGKVYDKNKLADAIKTMNELNFEGAQKRIIYVYGDADPWNELAYYKYLKSKSEAVTIIIEGTAHCADLAAPRKSDPLVLTEARGVIKIFLRTWLELEGNDFLRETAQIKFDKSLTIIKDKIKYVINSATDLINAKKKLV